MRSFHSTTAWEKLLNSAVNVGIVLILFLPLWLWLDTTITVKKMALIALFFTLKLGILFFNQNRSLGMMLTKTYWKEKYPLRHQLIQAVLYTLSFSTLLWWVYFPFDLFLANMLLIQLPTVLRTGTTFHGYVAGRMVTVKRG